MLRLLRSFTRSDHPATRRDRPSSDPTSCGGVPGAQTWEARFTSSGRTDVCDRAGGRADAETWARPLQAAGGRCRRSICLLAAWGLPQVTLPLGQTIAVVRGGRSA